MIRKIIHINEEKCIGCGICANACKLNALHIVDGKAKLISNDYCDGLGKCMPKCPKNAISFSDIDVTIKEDNNQSSTQASDNNCPSHSIKTFNRNTDSIIQAPSPTLEVSETVHKISTTAFIAETNLNQWPVQIKLVSENASYLDNAKLLIAADCAAYAYGNFHQEFMKNKTTIIGCPKLDDIDYSEKITAMLKNNNIKSVAVVRMDVPCCAGIENSVKTALKNCEKLIPWEVVTLTTDGKILEV